MRHPICTAHSPIGQETSRYCHLRQGHAGQHLHPEVRAAWDLELLFQRSSGDLDPTGLPKPLRLPARFDPGSMSLMPSDAPTPRFLLLVEGGGSVPVALHPENAAPAVGFSRVRPKQGGLISAVLAEVTTATPLLLLDGRTFRPRPGLEAESGHRWQVKP